MTEVTNFDILLVYSGYVADSAGSLSDDILAPFAEGKSYECYNEVYGYFLTICRKNKLKAAFTTTKDIVGAGKCSSYWLFEKNSWIKVKNNCYSELLFDKFSALNDTAVANRKLLFSSPRIRPFNNPQLSNLFFDKQKTYKKLKPYSIPTITVNSGSVNSIDVAHKKLKKIVATHPHSNDFSQEIILKDRFGSGGKNVYKFKGDQFKQIRASLNRLKEITYIIQPFTNFDKGYTYRQSHVSADIRLIFLGGRIVQTYIRMAKNGDFRCNEHQGGLLKYLPIDQIPKKVVDCAEKIAKALNNDRSLFTLDFLISNHGNVYLLEANTNPGLDWNLSLKENEIEAKKLIRSIVKELVKRVNPHRVSEYTLNFTVPVDTLQPLM